MNSILVLILIPNIFILILYYFINKKVAKGSDHAYHESLIDSIKRNKNKFVNKTPFLLNEDNFTYPQLFHWLVSFLPEKVYKEKYIYINLIIKAIELVAFNVFIYFLYNKINFKEDIFLYANIIFNMFPLSYASWNAKNMGLSARGIGVLCGHIYIYFLIAYLLADEVLLLLPLFCSIFIIMLTSQMAMQYVILSLPLIALIFQSPEILLFPFVAFGVFYFLTPTIAKSYIKGQYNHKRNYALFLAEIFILKDRPSIYRDFVSDFWVKLRKNFINGIAYIYVNPLVEIIYGMPFLWCVIYLGTTNEINGTIELLLYKIIIIALIIFFLVSFRETRFLGEPQRYLEFIIPIITILYTFHFGVSSHLCLISFSLLFILVTGVESRGNKKTQARKTNRNDLISYLSENNKFKNSTCISNDLDLMKFFLPLQINIARPDLTRFYKDKLAFYNNFNNDFKVLGKEIFIGYLPIFKPDFVIINRNFYDLKELKLDITEPFLHVIDIHEFSIFEGNKQKVAANND
jgi:hypothetical protein